MIVSQIPKRQILVVCEGSKTEPGYLRQWEREHRSITIVDVVRGGVPTSIVTEAIDRQNASKRRGAETYDSIWVMFDCDDHPDVKGQVNRAEQAGLQVAFSNPCIELWFLLHFQDQTAFLDRRKAQDKCHNHLSPGKALTPEDFQMLLARYEQARERAMDLARLHEGNGSWTYENPSSTVWKLIDDIRGTGRP